MYLNNGHRDGRDGIADGIGVVRERTRIENDPVVFSLCALDGGADLPFQIVLEELDRNAQFFGKALNALVDLAQCLRAVNAFFASARHVEVDPVQDKNVHSFPP